MGYGHGVGLNQYGARGRALEGQTGEQILATYFKGSRPATTNPARNVRVLLMSGYSAPSSAPLVIYGRGGTWGISSTTKVFPANARLKTWRTTATVDGVATTTWRMTVIAMDGTVLYASVVSGSPMVRPLEPVSSLQLLSKGSTYDTYRGQLRLLLKASSVTVVNYVGLDSYLRGVVPLEMPSTWPVEALRAQAVTARSYAVRRLHPTTGSFDLYDDTRSQVYRGLEAEKSVTNALIAASPGAILMYGTSVVNAFYCSTGGGATESNEYAFNSSTGSVGTAVAYLRGIVDRSAAGIPYDAAAPYFKWSTSTLTLAQLSAMFKADSRTNVGDLLRLDLRRRGVSGRLYAVVLYGTAATKTVSGTVFQSVYNARRPSGTAPIRSTMFDTKPLP
jgi:stage II sporulation protein D